MVPSRRKVELDIPVSSGRSVRFTLPLGYWALLIYYVAIHALLGFSREFFFPPTPPSPNAYSMRLLQTGIVHFALFVGVTVLILALFGIYLFPLTYHRSNFFVSFLGWLVTLALMLALAVGWFALLKMFGFSLLSIKDIQDAKIFFATGINQYLWAPTASFLCAGFPAEFFRAVVLSGGIRTNNSFIFSFLLIVTSIAFGLSYAYLGAPILVTQILFGFALGLYYFLRQRFWELVLLHSAVMLAFLVVPFASLPML